MYQIQNLISVCDLGCWSQSTFLEKQMEAMNTVDKYNKLVYEKFGKPVGYTEKEFWTSFF